MVRSRRRIAIFGGVILLTLFGLVGSAAAAQSNQAVQDAEPTVIRIGVDDGLPTTDVHSIVEDVDGVIWFASSGGLAHWNGTAAVSHPEDTGTPGVVINSVAADPDVGIWATSGNLLHLDHWSNVTESWPLAAELVTAAGSDALWLWNRGTLQLFDLETRSVQESLVIDLAPLLPGQVPMGTDSGGSLFLGSRSGAVVVRTDGSLTEWPIPSGVSSIARSGNGDVLAAGPSGVWMVRSEQRPERIAPLSPNQGDPWTPSAALLERSDGSILVGDTNGLVHEYVDGEWSSFDLISFGVTGEILAIVEDSNQGLWASQSGAGVIHIEDRPALFQSIGAPPFSTTWEPSAAFSDIVYSDGSILAATRGGGLQRYDLDSQAWQQVQLELGHLSRGVQLEVYLQEPSAVAVAGEKLWVGTWGHGLHHMEGDPAVVHLAISSESEYIYDLVPAPDGTVWASTWGYGVQQFDQFGSLRNRLSTETETPIQNARVRAILPLGDVIVLGGDRGLDIVDLTTDTCQTFSYDNGTLVGHEVFDIYAQSPSVFWLATDAGLERLDVETGSSELLGTDAGLGSNRLLEVIQHRTEAALWLISDHGVALFDLAQEVVVGSFRSSPGLPESSFVAGAYAVDDEGTSYIAAAGRILALPSTLPAISSDDLSVHARCVDGCGEDFDGRTVDNDSGALSFELLATGVSLGSGADLEYRLTPHDEDWIRSAPGQQLVTYNNLEVGEYRFEARLVGSGETQLAATDSDRPGGSLDLRVTQSWWKSTWVRVLAFVVIVLGAAAIAGLRSIQSRRHAEHLAGLVHERTLELKESTRRAEEANEAKTRFLTMVTHEFRSPLTSVVGYADLLKASSGTSKEGDWATAIRVSGEHLQAMIDDVLHFTAHESSNMEPRNEPTRIGELVHEILAMFGNDASRAQMVLACDVDERVTETDHLVDQRRLRQVLINLTANALRHSNGREVDLEVSLQTRSQKSDRLSFAVIDDGQGIAAGELDRIFEPWQRGDEASSPGLGLGLTISQEIVAMLGGELGCERVDGTTRFRFDLDLERAPVRGQGEIKRSKVMLVDDDEFSRVVVSELISALGYPVEAFPSARAALDAVDYMRPAVVLTDIMMPDMSGIAFAHALRGKANGSELVIVAMTGVPRESVNTGLFDQILAKPFGLARLGEVMADLHLDHAQPATTVAATESSRPG